MRRAICRSNGIDIAANTTEPRLAARGSLFRRPDTQPKSEGVTAMNRVENPEERFNWTRSDSTWAKVEVAPATPADLVKIVNEVEHYPSPVRAVGSLHSTNPCFATNEMGTHARAGTIVRMKPNFASVRVFEVPPAHGQPLEPGDEQLDPGVYVRVGAGATMLDIRSKLRTLGRELAVSPEIGNATAAAVACGGIKDSTLWPKTTRDQSQISSLVVEMKLVDASGSNLRVDRGGVHVIAGTGPTLPSLDLNLLRSSYGLCGIVYEVTFKTVALVPIKTSYEWVEIQGMPMPTPQQIPDEEAIFGGADTVLAFMQPYRGGMILERRVQSPDAQITNEDKIRRALRDWLWEWGAVEAATAATDIAQLNPANPKRGFELLLASALESALSSTVENPLRRALLGGASSTPGHLTTALWRLCQALGMPPTDEAHATVVALSPLMSAIVAGSHVAIPDLRTTLRNKLFEILDYVPGPVFETLGGFTGYRSDSMLDFAEPRYTAFDFTFWTYPLCRWQETVSEYFRFCNDPVHNGFRPSLFTQIYFLGADELSYLSPFKGGPVFCLDVAHSVPNNPEGWQQWRTFNERYNLWAVQHGGRPFLNQTKYLEPIPNVAAAVLDKAFPVAGEDWKTFSRTIWQANPPVADSPDGRFVNGFFKTLLHQHGRTVQATAQSGSPGP